MSARLSSPTSSFSQPSKRVNPLVTKLYDDLLLKFEVDKDTTLPQWKQAMTHIGFEHSKHYHKFGGYLEDPTKEECYHFPGPSSKARMSFWIHFYSYYGSRTSYKDNALSANAESWPEELKEFYDAGVKAFLVARGEDVSQTSNRRTLELSALEAIQNAEIAQRPSSHQMYSSSTKSYVDGTYTRATMPPELASVLKSIKNFSKIVIETKEYRRANRKRQFMTFYYTENDGSVSCGGQHELHNP